jgi:hypothetical protein
MARALLAVGQWLFKNVAHLHDHNVGFNVAYTKYSNKHCYNRQAANTEQG